MSDPSLFYRPADDAFVVRQGTADTAINAAQMLQRKVLCARMLKVGVQRFISWKEWQCEVAGRVLFHGSPEQAMAELPRLL